MATLAHDVTRWLADEWEKLYPSATFSGIVGDPEHEARGGYHISIEDQVNPDNYSVVRVDDKAPPGTWPRNLAAAIDMNLAMPDMRTCHLRLRAAWSDQTDPRRKYINAWNGWDGTNGAGRYDMVLNKVGSATDDHKWHIHLEIRRRYVTDRAAAGAILSILRGESKAQWMGEDDMAIRDDPDAWAQAWRTEALVAGRDSVAAGPTKGEPVWVVRAIKALATAVGQSDEAVAAQLRDEFAAIEAAVKDSEPVDPQAVAQSVLTVLTPQAIAAAIPAEIADQVADELAARLQS